MLRSEEHKGQARVGKPFIEPCPYDGEDGKMSDPQGQGEKDKSCE